MEKDIDKYLDIIDLPHPDPANRSRMTMAARAAQFSSFAALDGHEKAISDKVSASLSAPLKHLSDTD